MLDYQIRMPYNQPMAKTIASRIGLSVTADDKRLITQIKKQLKPTHGAVSTVVLFRMALRKLAQEA